MPDYVWYGGDDTSETIILFMSVGEHYQRTDIIKTAAAGWVQRFQKRAPDFAALDEQYGIRSIVLERSATELTLNIVIGLRSENAQKQTHRFRITQRDFKE